MPPSSQFVVVYLLWRRREPLQLGFVDDARRASSVRSCVSSNDSLSLFTVCFEGAKRMISYVVRVLGIVVVVLLQAGCGAQIAALHGIPVVNPADSEAVFAGTRLVTDSHEGSITVMGPTIFHDHDLLKNTYTIRAWVNPSKPELNNRFQVLVRAFFPKRV